MTEGVNPMPDPKLAGSPIVKKTMCRVGAHMWIQSASTMAYRPRISDADGGMMNAEVGKAHCRYLLSGPQGWKGSLPIFAQ